MTTTPEVQDLAGVHTMVRRFLSRYVDDATLLDEDRLLTGGLLDSLAAVELIAQMERWFAITVDDDDLDVANFDSLAAIAAFVWRKLGR